jgi:ABC-2 type transport system ATP-binding protein
VSYGVDAVTVRFGATTALSDVSLDLPPGQVTAVVGGDGAGKSTLLRTLVGEVVVDSGALRIPGASEVGYLAAGAGSWKDLTVDQNVAFVGGAYGLSGRTLAERADRLLERAGLTGARGRLARQLSGGMRTKLGFVLAMLHQPRLLVLDEPSTGVDPVSRVELWRLVSETAAAGAAVVLSTTYLDEAERAASVLLLAQGRGLLSGAPDELVAAMPGAVTRVPSPTRPELAWRRGAAFHEWWPDGGPGRGEPVRVDLSDVSIVAELAAGDLAGRSRG